MVKTKLFQINDLLHNIYSIGSVYIAIYTLVSTDNKPSNKSFILVSYSMNTTNTINNTCSDGNNKKNINFYS